MKGRAEPASNERLAVELYTERSPIHRDDPAHPLLKGWQRSVAGFRHSARVTLEQRLHRVPQRYPIAPTEFPTE